MRIMPSNVRACKAQSIGEIAKRLIVNMINDELDPLTREDCIQTAVEEGVLSYADAYQLRTDGDI